MKALNKDALNLRTIYSKNDVDRIENEILRSGEGSGSGLGSGSGNILNIEYEIISDYKDETISSGYYQVSCRSVATAKICKLTLNNNTYYALDSVTCVVVVNGKINPIEEFDYSQNQVVIKEYKTEVSDMLEDTKKSVGFNSTINIGFEPSTISVTKKDPNNNCSYGTFSAEGQFIVANNPTPHIEQFFMTYDFI